MGSAPSKIHLTTASYLRRWTVDGVLMPVDVRYGRQKLKAPAGTGWERDWWGAGDARLNAACEDACRQLESVVPRAIDRVLRSWPPSSDDRALLAQFMALHVVRTSAFTEWFEVIRDQSIAEVRSRFDEQDVFDDFARQMRWDSQRAKRLLGLISRAASVLGSMHWTLIEFAEPILITSDQPVSVVPLMDDGGEAPVLPLPRDGLINSLEARFALSPRAALLGSWSCESEVGNVVAGSWEDAVQLNGVWRDQCHRRWFRHPHRVPAMPLNRPGFDGGDCY